VDNADFSGYATKAGLKCSDGRMITADAFKHMDGIQVPLVWQHGHSSPENVLGHAVLEHREDGVYAYGFFNDTRAGQNTKALVQHGDITSLSIYANGLLEKLVAGAKQVLHGVIREVSLVLSGANPGALIDYVSVQHGDGTVDTLEDEAVIYTGLELEHAVEDMTIQEVYESLTEEQQDLVHYLVGAAMGETTVAQSATPPATTTTTGASVTVTTGTTVTETSEGDLTHQEGTTVTRNVFETGNDSKPAGEGHVLTHDAMQGILSAARKSGSLKTATTSISCSRTPRRSWTVRSSTSGGQSGSPASSTACARPPSPASSRCRPI
jgi:hypothetical protein